MVIQRWQTVYLIMAVLVLAISAFFPAYGFITPEGNGEASLGAILAGGETAASAMIYFIIIILSAALSLINIFKFKNLGLQKTICSVTMLLLVAAMVVLAIGIIMLPEDAAWSLKLASMASPFALICVALAKYRIEKDDKLLKSAYRIR